MKCPNCCSPMLVTDETAGLKSQVTFYRCSICSGQHVSAEPVARTFTIAVSRQAVDPPALVNAQPSLV